MMTYRHPAHTSTHVEPDMQEWPVGDFSPLWDLTAGGPDPESTAGCREAHASDMLDDCVIAAGTIALLIFAVWLVSLGKPRWETPSKQGSAASSLR